MGEGHQETGTNARRAKRVRRTRENRTLDAGGRFDARKREEGTSDHKRRSTLCDRRTKKAQWQEEHYFRKTDEMKTIILDVAPLESAEKVSLMMGACYTRWNGCAAEEPTTKTGASRKRMDCTKEHRDPSV